MDSRYAKRLARAERPMTGQVPPRPAPPQMPHPRLRRHSETGPAQPPTSAKTYGDSRAGAAPHRTPRVVPQQQPPHRQRRWDDDSSDSSSSSSAGSYSDTARSGTFTLASSSSGDLRRTRTRHDDHRSHLQRWPTLDPYHPHGVKPQESVTYWGHQRSQPAPQPRRRATSLLRYLTQGGMAMFEINPRWAKRRPLV